MYRARILRLSFIVLFTLKISIVFAQDDASKPTKTYSLGEVVISGRQIGISYSILKTKDKSVGSQRDELQNRPKTKFVIDANYTFDFGLTVSADYTRTGEQFFYSSNYEKGTLSDYSIVNLRLEQKLYKDLLSVYIGADNFLDENYQESYGYPRAGRTAYAGVRYKF